MIESLPSISLGGLIDIVRSCLSRRSGGVSTGISSKSTTPSTCPSGLGVTSCPKYGSISVANLPPSLAGLYGGKGGRIDLPFPKPKLSPAPKANRPPVKVPVGIVAGKRFKEKGVNVSIPILPVWLKTGRSDIVIDGTQVVRFASPGLETAIPDELHDVESEGAGVIPLVEEDGATLEPGVAEPLVPVDLNSPKVYWVFPVRNSLSPQQLLDFRSFYVKVLGPIHSPLPMVGRYVSILRPICSWPVPVKGARTHLQSHMKSLHGDGRAPIEVSVVCAGGLNKFTIAPFDVRSTSKGVGKNRGVRNSGAFPKPIPNSGTVVGDKRRRRSAGQQTLVEGKLETAPSTSQ